ncbi:MAG TPA: hypothetical protein VGG06_17825 [Thermoanaerobaculia bacterium]
MVVGSGLLGRSLERLTAVDPGFEADPLLCLRLELPRDAYPDKAQRIGLFRRLLDRLEALPGVKSAAASGVQLPLVGGQGTFELFVESHPRGDGPENVVTAQAVSPGYFRTMGIPLIAGQPFAAGDTWESSRAVIVNEAFARRFWPGGDAVGRWWAAEWRRWPSVSAWASLSAGSPSACSRASSSASPPPTPRPSVPRP